MVANLKSAHRRWHKLMTRALAVWLIVGLVAGLATWFAQAPINRDSTLLGGVLALGVAIFFLGSMLTRILFPKPDTKCPQCGHDLQGSEPNEDWLTWKCCPACGSKLGNGTNEQEGP